MPNNYNHNNQETETPAQSFAESNAQLRLENKKLKKDIAKYKKERNENFKQTKRDLREIEDRYRTLVDLGTKIGEAIVMLQDINDSEGIHTHVSDQWPQITGYSKEELLKISFFDLISPDDRAISIKRHRQKMAGITIPDLFELVIVRKDNTEIPIEVTSAAANYKGKLTNIAYIRDISERKRMQGELEKHHAHLEYLVAERTRKLERELSRRKRIEKALKISEEKYRSLFQNVPVAVFEVDYSEVKKYVDKLRSQGITDVEGYFDNNLEAFKECTQLSRLIDVNKENVDLFEAENKDEIFRVFSENKKDQSQYYKSFKKILYNIVNNKNPFSYEEFIPTVKGNWQHHIVKVNPAPGYEKTYSRLYFSIFDITELKKLEYDLEKAYESEKFSRKKLEGEIKQRLEFTRLLVHELKTPLTSMIVTSEMLSKQHDGDLKTVADTLYSSSIALNKRIDELMDITRGEIGMLSIAPYPCDIISVVKKTAKDLSYVFKKNKQSFTLNTDNSELIISIDPERISQVLDNLLVNASKFTPEGGSVTLRTKIKDNMIVIEVEDNGLGIINSEKQKIFEPYYSRKFHSKPYLGMGLGLALAKMIITLHSGYISVRDAKHKGSIFSFSLPIKNRVSV